MRKLKGRCPNCDTVWSLRNLLRYDYRCPKCSHQIKRDSTVEVRSAKGKILTPCTIERADKEVSAHRARWDNGTLWLFDAPEMNAIYRRFVFERDKGICLWCGGQADTVDHIVPRSHGGLFHPKNLFCACETCNFTRQDLDALRNLERLMSEGRPSPYVGHIRELYRTASAYVQEVVKQ